MKRTAAAALIILSLLTALIFIHFKPAMDFPRRQKTSVPESRRRSGRELPLTPIAVPLLDQRQARERLKRDSSILLLDVRTEEEYGNAHIPGAVLLPLGAPDTYASELRAAIPDKNKTVFIYCRSGNRSGTAGSMMIKMGYQNVFNMGGITTWPFDIVKKETVP